MSDYLPQEVIHNILVRLPIKSLIKCTSVCKSWSSMIKDSSFIRSHLNHTIDLNDRHDTHLLLLHMFSRNYNDITKLFMKEEVYSLHHDNHAFDEYCKIGFQSPIPGEKAHSERFQVIGVCNGLVCLRDDSNCESDYKYIIWNPSIRKLVTFPKLDVNDQTPGRYADCHGFAFDAITNDYKVVRLVVSVTHQHSDCTCPVGCEYKDEKQTFVEVYSLAAGSWSSSRYVDPIRSIMGQGTHAFVHGALHWYAHSSASSSYHYIILAFDVGSESFQEIMMPKRLEMDMVSEEVTLTLQMSVSGNSLALFAGYYTHSGQDLFLNIWLMKEYCVEDSWTKLITLRPQGPGRRLPDALCFQKSGGVVMVQDLAQDNYIIGRPRMELVSLDLVSGQLKNLGISQYQHYTIDSYMESIVLLDRNDAFSC